MKCDQCEIVIPIDDRFGRRMANHKLLAHTVFDVRPDPLRTAASALADARVRFAREFARLKLANPGMTDKAAMFAATESTNDEVTRLEAECEIARRIN